ncbi:glucosamine kinase [Mycolicibacterium goodii]|uniref:glucosamine kinase n=1 Tax=Mycolicibacterium goodii TaxID=134601 RepID=UPI001BDC940C|nr:glucosamine kinase [Mycolicibacterium goodii]MBU8830112.1 aminoglycoside phosphotransferase [Mycolicibacterium goodii]
MIELDHLDLGDGRRLVITSGPDGPAATPSRRDADGHWRRAEPGDGVAEAMLDVLSGNPGTTEHGNFTLISWAPQTARGERPITVDQTNESVIVGDRAVVKWATHLQEGPHPAPARISALRGAGFRGMPTPWGLVMWQPPGQAETLVVTVDEYLPHAEDGWTWAVALVTDAAQHRAAVPALLDAITAVGFVVAELHAAQAITVNTATAADARAWREAALETVETAATLGRSVSGDLLRARRTEIETILRGLGDLAGSPVLAGHGDLHVGQVLRAGRRFVITDFDGNPVLPAEARVKPVPAALDVAGMAQSLVHVAIVARKYADLDLAVLADIDRLSRGTFIGAYTDRLAALGHSAVYDPAPLRALRLQQVLREMIYAARHLPRWMYVPDAALPALLDEGTTT